ncbi:unnamed protein product, partial [Ectocarpus sp. 4 AP-2014]
MKGLISDGGQPPVKPIRGLYSNQHVHQTAVVPTSCRFLIIHTGYPSPQQQSMLNLKPKRNAGKSRCRQQPHAELGVAWRLARTYMPSPRPKQSAKSRRKFQNNAQRDARYHTPRTNFWHTHPGPNFRGSLPLGPKRCVVPTTRFREVVHESVQLR